MDADELLRQAKEKLDQMQKDIAELKKLNLAALMPPERGRRKDPRHDHGAVIIRAKGGIIEAGTTVPEPPKEETEYTRTVSPMRVKHQRSMMERIWKYRNFKRCGNCGSFDSYESRSLADTNGIRFFCYTCSAQDDAVTEKYNGEESGIKFRPMECVGCGKEIHLTRGDLAFPTGEIDPNTHRSDYLCGECKKK